MTGPILVSVQRARKARKAFSVADRYPFSIAPNEALFFPSAHGATDREQRCTGILCKIAPADREPDLDAVRRWPPALLDQAQQSVRNPPLDILRRLFNHAVVGFCQPNANGLVRLMCETRIVRHEAGQKWHRPDKREALRRCLGRGWILRLADSCGDPDQLTGGDVTHDNLFPFRRDPAHPDIAVQQQEEARRRFTFREDFGPSFMPARTGLGQNCAKVVPGDQAERRKLVQKARIEERK